MCKEKSDMRQNFVIIDGNSLMYRAFYGMPPLTNSKGLHTNVILGFVNMIGNISEKLKPSHFAIAFDRKAPTFRHKEFEEYKAGRQKMPDEMIEQIPVLKKVLEYMNISQIELDGYEADDIIGTLSSIIGKLGVATYIVTGDKDAFQLINDNVHVMYTKRGISDMEEYDEAFLMEKMQITPAQVVDMKALMGDASDNIPGIAGVGEKTALDLIKTFGTLDNIYKNSHEIAKKGVREKVQNGKDIAYLSYRLATICCQVPIDTELDSFKIKEVNKEALREIYTELNFRGLLSKFKDEEIGREPAPEAELLIGYDVRIFSDKVKKSGKLYLKIGDNMMYSRSNDNPVKFELSDENLSMVEDILKDERVGKYGHDLKSDNLYLRQRGILMEGEAFDIAIASYLIDPTQNNYGETIFAETHDELMIVLPKLCDELERELKEKELLPLFEQVEMPLINILADMEYIGFSVNKEVLTDLGKSFGAKLDGLTESIYLMAGEEFNINSTKQLGTILFEKLELPTAKKTKTGYSTNVEVLEGLIGKHPIIENILEYRQLSKLKSTYIDGLLNIINIKTGRIHSRLNQMVTATGRLSSTEPNLQNIPIKTEEGRQIRKAFIARDGCLLLDADYSQIELRVLAHISQDENMIDAFVHKEDIHTKTASEVFGVEKSEVTQTMRGRAKAINFGIVYGLSDFGLAKDLGISRKEAKLYIENYFTQYPKVKVFMDSVVEKAKEDGYVTTILNRRRYISEINSKNAIMRGMGERIAMNTPIQGSAADIIKIAMVKVHRGLEKDKLKSKLILQVHDELIIETYPEEMDQVKELVKNSMEQAYEMRVPVVADIGIGESWYEAK